MADDREEVERPDEKRPRRAGPKGPGSRARATPSRRPPRPFARRVVLASVGPPIPGEMIDRLVAVAAEVRGGDEQPLPVVHVVSIARIWGTSLGLPNPGLYPNRIEIEEQRRIVDTASAALVRRGYVVKSRILSARRPARVIARYAESIGAKAIVVGDPTGGFRSWERVVKGSETRELARRTRIPVHPVSIDAPMPRSTGRPGDPRTAEQRPTQGKAD